MQPLNFKFIFVSLLSLLGNVTMAMADNPIVPAGSASTGAGAPVQQAPSLMSSLPMFAVMFAIIYFLMIRPQQKKMKEQQHGDEVVTASGLLGKVTGITDKVITLEVADNVRVKMLKSQISQVLKGPITEN